MANTWQQILASARAPKAYDDLVPSPEELAAMQDPASRMTEHPPMTMATPEDFIHDDPESIDPAAKAYSQRLKMSGNPMSKVGVNLNQRILDVGNQSAREAMAAVNRQNSELSNFKDQVAQYGQRPQQIDFSPLAAYFDSNMEGSKLTPVALAQREDPGAKAEKMLALQNQIQGRQGDISKATQDALKMQLDAYKAAKEDNSKYQFKVDMQRDRIDERNHSQVVNKVTNNQILGQRLNQVNNLSNALAAFEQGTATPQQFEELQQAVRSNMGIKGTSTGVERDSTKLKQLGINAASVNQFLTGKPQDIRDYVNPEMVNHIGKLARIEIGNVQKQADLQLNTLMGGHKSMYERNPHLKEDLLDLAQTSAARFAVPTGAGSGGNGGKAAKDMTDEELKKFLGISQ